MAEKINRRFAIDTDKISKVARSHTDKPPAHFTLKIESFRSLYNIMITHALAQSYESDIFEARGYKWKLSLYPNGDQEKNAHGYISLYLEIVDTHDLPEDWEVVANLKFFVYNHFNKYLTVEDATGLASRFDAKNTVFGFARVLPYSSFIYDGNGYLVNDKCIFGVEVVKNYLGTGCTVDSLSMVTGFYSWKIEKYSSLTQECYLSNQFTIGNQNWKLELHPKGDSRSKNETLSVFMVAQDCELFPERKTFVKYSLCLVNQRGGKDIRIQSLGQCYSKATPKWGYPAFIPLADLEDASKGFLVNDTLIIQVQVDVFSSVRSFDSMIFQTEETKVPQEKVKIEELLKQTKGKMSSKTTRAEETKIPQEKVKIEELLKQTKELLKQTKELVKQTKELLKQTKGKMSSKTIRAEETKIPQEKVKIEELLTQTKGKISSKQSGIGTPKETRTRKPSRFRKWFV